jgi:hypothetical protein
MSTLSKPTLSSDEHTPGPWKVIPSPHGKDYRCVQYGKDKTYTSLEMLPMDAALTAAAPDLLALARQCASECADCGGKGQIVTRSGGSGWGNGGPDVCEEIEDCDACAHIWAVINKARGRV